MSTFFVGAFCERNKYGDFVFWPKVIKSYIRLGVGHFYRELADTKAYEIEKIIRPRKAYPSGGYGVKGEGKKEICTRESPKIGFS